MKSHYFFYFYLIDNVQIGPDGSVLTVSNARPGNQGQYICTVNTTAGRGSATAVLNVKCEPHNNPEQMFSIE